MVQHMKLSPPVQLASEVVQLVVWLLAEDQSCKNGGRAGGRTGGGPPTGKRKVSRHFVAKRFGALPVFTVEGGESFVCGVRSESLVRGRKRLSILEVGLPDRGSITVSTSG